MRTLTTLTLLFTLLASAVLAEEAKPLKALLITGGGYHDYAKQKTILTEGISARANVEWTVILENPARGAMPKLYENKDWAKGYDVIVHNDCFASYKDVEGVERIVQDHIDNKVGVVMIHCAMHTFRDAKTKAWDKLVGVESRRHGAKYPITIRNLGREHAITKDLPAMWTTPQGELYMTSALADTVILGVGYKEGEEAKTKQVCIWASEYENLRTFGTTLGHHNETMQEEVYLDMVAKGLLWSCHKLDDNGQPLDGYGATARVDHPTKIQVVLASGQVRQFNSQAEFAAANLPQVAIPCCGQK